MTDDSKPGLVGDLYWRTAGGTMVELKRVGNKLFNELVPGVKGIPVYNADPQV
jgi:hypothetical protein